MDKKREKKKGISSGLNKVLVKYIIIIYYNKYIAVIRQLSM